jgi:tRNA uridine 5-carbamoylmethylation protein Kti12
MNIIFIKGLGSQGKSTFSKELEKVLSNCIRFEIDCYFVGWDEELNYLFNKYNKNIYKATNDNINLVGKILEKIIEKECLIHQDKEYLIFEGYSLFTVEEFIKSMKNKYFIITAKKENGKYNLYWEKNIIEDDPSKLKKVLDIIYRL